MASLDVIQSPGCADLIAEDLQAISDRGGVVIDTGRIAESLGWDPTDPNRNQAILRVAVGMRTTAIKIARDHNLEGVVRTSNTAPAALERLTAQAGGTLRTVHMTRAEACRRIRKLFLNNRERQAMCEEGLDRYYGNAT